MGVLRLETQEGAGGIPYSEQVVAEWIRDVLGPVSVRTLACHQRLDCKALQLAYFCCCSLGERTLYPGRFVFGDVIALNGCLSSFETAGAGWIFAQCFCP